MNQKLQELQAEIKQESKGIKQDITYNNLVGQVGYGNIDTNSRITLTKFELQLQFNGRLLAIIDALEPQSN